MRKIKCGGYFIGISGKFFSERFLIEKQGRVLRKKTYLSAVYRYFSAVLLERTADKAEQGLFSCAVAAHYCGYAPLLYVKRKVSYNISFAVFIAKRQIFNGYTTFLRQRIVCGGR